MASVNIGLSESQRANVCRMLGLLLADEFVLYTRTRNFHWHVSGPRFNDLHQFFESQYDALAERIDEIAERILSLGMAAPATLAEYVRLARLTEQPGATLTAEQMCAALLADHEAIIRQLRSDVELCGREGDAGTNDFLTGLMEEHEKMAWMLRALAS